MKNRLKGIIVVILFITFLSTASFVVSGEIYTWKDKDGNIIFSDIPSPPGVHAEVEVKESQEESIERPKTKEYLTSPSLNFLPKNLDQHFNNIYFRTLREK